jgi:hypothetical protein
MAIQTNRTTAKIAGTGASIPPGDYVWNDPGNITADDGNMAWWAAASGGAGSDLLRATNFGFNIPSNAVIDGVLVSIDLGFRSGEYVATVQLRTNAATSNNKATFGSMQASYGGVTDLWGMTLTPAIVNGSDFGFQIDSNDVSGGDAQVNIDYIQITIYWHYDATVAPAEVETRYDYKIYSPTNAYIGNLPGVVSEYSTSQDINSAGSQLPIEVASGSLDDAAPIFAPGNLLQWLAGAWDYRARISIQKTKVTAVLTDFPVLFNLAHMDSNFWANVKTDGSDIRFTDAYGTVEVPFELINFNKTNKTGEVWFKAPKLTNEYDNFFYIYYGNAGASAYAATDTYGSRNVWDANFKAVYHLDENANTTASGYKDATANQTHGTGVSMSQAAVAGKSVQAAEFDGTDDYISISSVHGLGNTNATLSCWVYVSSTNQNGTFVKVGTGANGYAMGQGNTTFEDNGGNLIMIYDGVRWIVTSHFFTIGWNLVHMTVSASGVPTAYVNGALVNSYSGTNAIAPTTSSGIGNNNVANRWYSDAIDEVRYSNTPRSAAWIAAEYASQNNPSTFYSIGSFQTRSTEGYTAMLRNGNLVNVYETSYYYPNGKLMYQGQINRVEANFNPDIDGLIKVLCHSDGRDLDNMVARGAPFTYTDQVTQTSQNSRVSNITYDYGGWERQGQSFRTGAAQTNIGRLRLLLDGTATVTVRIYTNPSLNTQLGSVTKSVSVAGPTAVDFEFADMIPVSSSTDYFFTIQTGNNQSIWVHFSNANPYANGARYNSSYAGGSGGGSYAIDSANDLYFIVSSGTPSTQATYTSKDPTTQMLKPIIDDYRNRGGLIAYNDVLNTVDATGLSLTISFNTNTILEAMNKILDMSPAGFYYYVDLGTNTLWFKETSRTADFIFVKGRHVEELSLIHSIENVINDILFSGGPTAGVNLYAQYSDYNSKSMYGTRLDRKSDNRVTVQATADAIGNSKLQESKNEMQHTGVTIHSRTMDITLLRPGKTVGFRGYGNFIDNMLLQIVKVDYNARRAVLQVGTMPMRFNTHIEQTLRGLIAEQTLANPSTPA